MSDFDLESFKKAFQNWPQAVEASQEIERLQGEVNELKWDGALNEAEKKIESLTKERDELKEEVKHEIEVSGRNVRLYKDTKEKLEAENAELRGRNRAEAVEIETLVERLQASEDSNTDLTQKLADAEGERDKLKADWSARYEDLQ